jgi:hypothetical protein
MLHLHIERLNYKCRQCPGVFAVRIWQQRVVALLNRTGIDVEIP